MERAVALSTDDADLERRVIAEGWNAAA